jgi:DegT/DnrJ/EryC1/StrS aminotransferase family protein
MSLRAVRVGAGDEVITVANAGGYMTAACLVVGARPVYIDVEPATCQLDPALLAEAVSDRTRALVITHLYGLMNDVAGLRRRLAALAAPRHCHHRGLCTGAWRGLRWRDGGDARRRRRIQLLSDQEPGSVRRRGRRSLPGCEASGTMERATSANLCRLCKPLAAWLEPRLVVTTKDSSGHRW